MIPKITSSFRLSSAVVACGLLISPLAHAQNFLYTNFSSSSGLSLNGSALAPAVGQSSNDVLQITPAQPDQAGSAFYNAQPIQLGNNASFSTAFSFQLWNGGGMNDGNSPPNPLGADGIVFVLGTGTTPVGAVGQGVGYQGIPHSVGIKFDTWQDGSNNGFPYDNDPNGNFVAVYNDGDTHLYDSVNPSDPYNNAANDAHGYYSPSDSMKNGNTWYAWIDYNGVTNEMDVSVSEVDVRPVTPDLSVNINLSDSSILGSAPAVYAGFTGGTGGAWDAEDILNWQFQDTYKPITVVGGGVPDSGPSVALLAALLAALCAVARCAPATRRLRT